MPNEFKDLKPSQEPRNVCAGIQTGFHNEEQLFHVECSEALPFLEATVRSALCFTENYKSPMLCPWLKKKKKNTQNTHDILKPINNFLTVATWVV